MRHRLAVHPRDVCSVWQRRAPLSRVPGFGARAGESAGGDLRCLPRVLEDARDTRAAGAGRSAGARSGVARVGCGSLGGRLRSTGLTGLGSDDPDSAVQEPGWSAAGEPMERGEVVVMTVTNEIVPGPTGGGASAPLAP